MKPTRRGFLQLTGVAGGATLLGTRRAAASDAASDAASEPLGVLVDTTKCIGCRRCEYACMVSHGLQPPPLDSFDDRSVMATLRRPEPRSYTVVNRHQPADGSPPVHAKLNCLHCLEPACVSACLVSALTRRPDGAVVYDPSRCMGCRYCMVACPFEMPAYDYDDPLTPQVRKCNLCAHLVPERQEAPACVRICPAEALTYGPRHELLELARERVSEHPEVYVPHIYGEHEAGGTAWLYLSRVPLETVGLWRVGAEPPGSLTESIQHNVFKSFGPPILFCGLLALIARLTRRPDDSGENAPNGRLP
jgi:Fe-S-cluster-containing dehydrogenase component